VRERRELAEEIRDYVVANLHDPDLSPDIIARRLHASKRTLHRAVRNLNGSLHNLIWHERLDRCRRDLLDPSKSDYTIAQIAHSWGFKNLSHFSSAFRNRFGLSAREARRAARSATEICMV
jgi:AraC-like DNA-binding protein